MGWKPQKVEAPGVNNIVEREPMWDGNRTLVWFSPALTVEREPMWDGNTGTLRARCSNDGG